MNIEYVKRETDVKLFKLQEKLDYVIQLLEELKERVPEKKRVSNLDEHRIAQEFINLWNYNCGVKLQQAKLNQFRISQILERFKEEPNLNYWKEVVIKISQSDFLTGGNQRAWRANFDWLLKPGNHYKIIEGQFNGENGVNPWLS